MLLVTPEMTSVCWGGSRLPSARIWGPGSGHRRFLNGTHLMISEILGPGLVNDWRELEWLQMSCVATRTVCIWKDFNQFHKFEAASLTQENNNNNNNINSYPWECEERLGPSSLGSTDPRWSYPGLGCVHLQDPAVYSYWSVCLSVWLSDLSEVTVSGLVSRRGEIFPITTLTVLTITRHSSQF